MKPVIIILFLFISCISYSQHAVSFSVKPSYSFTRVTKDLEDNMKESGFDDNSYGLFSPEQIAHPFTSRLGLGFLAELEIFAQKKLSLSFAGGLTDGGEVVGYDNVGIGNYLFFHYTTWIVNAALNYHYSSHKVSVGPTLASFTYKDGSSGGGSPSKFNETKWVEGISISNSFFTKKEKRIKTGLFVQANLFPNVKTREITVSHKTGIANPVPETHTSTFKSAKINISHLQLGLVIRI